jgi:hypothetical protein
MAVILQSLRNSSFRVTLGSQKASLDLSQGILSLSFLKNIETRCDVHHYEL